ncbi:NUDIX hydrolase domain-like protein [Nemania sp. FL0916]|nr:NUDIX hydrolase domain-like protein [Nemania sp. FL0916]
MDASNKSLHYSDSFAISCGTVSIDREASMVLLIRWRKTGEVFLPKGRKNVGETLEETAIRETFEETGLPVQLLPVQIKTLATSPSSKAATTTEEPTATTEPIAVTQRVANGVLKIIFWYVASGDSTAVPQEGTQQENEDFDTLWVHFHDLDATLTFEDDRGVARAAITAVRDTVVPA